MSAPVRSYHSEIVSRAEKMNGILKPNVLGELHYDGLSYPFLMVTSDEGSTSSKEAVVISGAVHGDEPSGAYAVIKFLEEDAPRYSNAFRIIAFPCVNPSGFEFGTRTNSDDWDINREFKNSINPQEVHLIKKFLREQQRVLVAVDLHEDNMMSDGFYMFESCKHKKLRMGHLVVDAVEKIAPVCKKRRIDGDKGKDGVIYYPEGYKEKNYKRPRNFERYLSVYHNAKNTFTTEMPACWDINKRIETHLTALRTVLDEARRRYVPA
jgi:murein peptide amidase A